LWDVGFGEDVKSQGLLMPGMNEPKCFQFACTNLVVEALLSACFNEDGNPTSRVCVERVTVGGKTKDRRWYKAGGILIAAMYVVRAIADAAPRKRVRLFEGFVSYKKGVCSNHRRDLTLL
jgi:hypothetical protein